MGVIIGARRVHLGSSHGTEKGLGMYEEMLWVDLGMCLVVGGLSG